jgi:pectate lyase
MVVEAKYGVATQAGTESRVYMHLNYMQRKDQGSGIKSVEPYLGKGENGKYTILVTAHAADEQGLLNLEEKLREEDNITDVKRFKVPSLKKAKGKEKKNV